MKIIIGPPADKMDLENSILQCFELRMFAGYNFDFSTDGFYLVE